jgi:hypothetical protein
MTTEQILFGILVPVTDRGRPEPEPGDTLLLLGPARQPRSPS